MFIRSLRRHAWLLVCVLVAFPVSAQTLSLAVSPETVTGGSISYGTVTLSDPMPKGGAVVHLSSDNPAVKVPPVVKVDTSNAPSTFTITTTQVTTFSTAWISATYEGRTKSAAQAQSLIVDPCLSDPFAPLDPVPPPMSFPSTDEPPWVDDELPPHAKPIGYWIPDYTQKASGSNSFTESHFQPPFGFWDANPGLHIRVGDWLVLYALIDPCNPPQELMVGFGDDSSSDAAWDHVAYWGANLITGFGTRPKYMGKLPQAGEWVRLEIKASTLGLEGRTIQGLLIDLSDGRVWIDRIGRSSTCTTPTAEAPSSFKPEDVWLEDEDSLVDFNSGGDYSSPTSPTPWIFDPFQKASGSNSFTMDPRAGEYDNFFVTPSHPSDKIQPRDNIVVYTLIDPCDPPQEILLQFRDFSDNRSSEWDHVAYWGNNLLVGHLGSGTYTKYMGTLPQAGKWLRLEIPADSVGMVDQKLSGIWMHMYGGHVWFDRMGIGTFPASTP
jgi:hypothetical protein